MIATMMMTTMIVTMTVTATIMTMMITTMAIMAIMAMRWIRRTLKAHSCVSESAARSRRKVA